MNTFRRTVLFSSLYIITLAAHAAAPDDSSFTIIVVPDTQNAIDYTHQKAEGFAFDASEIFMEEMRDIASRAVTNGGDVVFVTSVGDVWQHLSADMDPDHYARGLRAIDNPVLGLAEDITPQTLAVEIPTAIAGYRLISATGIPFGVAPGNHDYDAIWSAAGFVPDPGKAPGTRANTVADRGLAHVGGLNNFVSAFGSETEFFRNKNWYVSGYKGGGSSAQVFSAGGYEFLHFSFELQAGDDVLAWAQGVIDQHPGLPTMISTHDYMNGRGERTPSAILDLPLADPDGNNSAEEIWEKFISANDQILMVFSGHQLGQATRIDDNQSGHKVYQMLSDFQSRGQTALDAGQPPQANGNGVPIGDGWYRELNFDFSGDVPTVEVKTWSSYYKVYSSELPTYAQWYKHIEQPAMSDVEFLAADEFTLTLDDFYARFGAPGTR